MLIMNILAKWAEYVVALYEQKVIGYLFGFGVDSFNNIFRTVRDRHV